MRNISLGVLLLLLGISSTVASTIRHDQADADYLALAQSPEYDSVGTFVNNNGYSGSATLIAPNWVLTGAHLFAAASSGTFTVNGISYAGDMLVTHPNWNGNAFNGYDFGLVHLSTAISGVTPAMLHMGMDESGLIGTFVGFGMTGTGLTGRTTLDNQERAFQNVIDGNFGNPGILYGSDFDNPLNALDNDFGSPIPLMLEGAVASGDSGGAVFITVDSVTYLAGVISFIAGRDGNANADYGDVSGFGRVTAVTPWIFGVTGIPEPSAAALFVSGLSMLLWYRKRSH